MIWFALAVTFMAGFGLGLLVANEILTGSRRR